jgi:hypothetical protein
MKILFGFLLGIVLGVAPSFILFSQTTTKHHWKVVESYNAFINDPANYTPVPGTGLSAATPPADPEPSLAALVAARELTYVDLVLPSVPHSSETTRHWMKFCQAHKEIVYITERDWSHSIYKTVGTQPVHVNIWFREKDAAVVQTLIKELEENYAKAAP